MFRSISQSDRPLFPNARSLLSANEQVNPIYPTATAERLTMSWEKAMNQSPFTVNRLHCSSEDAN